MNPEFTDEEIRAWGKTVARIKNQTLILPEAIDLQRFIYVQNLTEEVSV